MNKLIELTERSQLNYVPKSADEFIGLGADQNGSGAKAVALHIERIVHQSKLAGNAPIRVLLNGNPGIGKTANALYLQYLLACNRWSTTKLNGTEVKVDKIEEITASLHYRSLFGDYRMVHIDEADAIPTVAQVRLLTVLDDLPKGIAVVCTSNCKLSQFENRFQSRFQVFELKPPTSAEIEAMLSDYIDRPTARHIANF
ncbi:MAG TPA: AAA family ATPase, partial [Candidatus Acidoferrum sp.]|nr:AAA family ATPase [Candidatus Acidoferrum sp.]